MTVVETIAKEKWCPFVRLSINTGSFNRHCIPEESGGNRCIGSECMCWKWTDTDLKYGTCGLMK